MATGVAPPVVLAADVMFRDIAPIMWVGPVERWLGALERIVELDPLTIVPGLARLPTSTAYARCARTGSSWHPQCASASARG
jgi:hypothetical protein